MAAERVLEGLGPQVHSEPLTYWGTHSTGGRLLRVGSTGERKNANKRCSGAYSLGTSPSTNSRVSSMRTAETFHIQEVTAALTHPARLRITSSEEVMPVSRQHDAGAQVGDVSTRWTTSFPHDPPEGGLSLQRPRNGSCPPRPSLRTVHTAFHSCQTVWLGLCTLVLS